MIKKLSKYGNSLALLLDKPILEILNISEKTRLKISTDGTKIILEPVREKKPLAVSHDNKVNSLYKELLKQYGQALKKLADD